MNKLKNSVNIIRDRYTLKQKFNYIKFLMSRKDNIHLSYDPITISAVATGRCNFSCNMCPTHSKIIPDDYPFIQETKKDMPIDLFKDVVNKFNKALYVHIIGSGEPLLNKDLFKMVNYAVKIKNMRVKTFSNGVAIRDNIGQIIESALDGITISINGHNSNEFARLTGMDEKWFPIIYDGVKNLVKERNKIKSKVKVKLSFIIDQENYVYIPEMVKTAEDLNVDNFFLCNFLPNPYDGFRAEERSIIVNNKLVVDFINKYISTLSDDIKKKITFPVLLNIKGKEKKCRVHFSQIRVDGEGNVSSCSMMMLNMLNHGHFYDNDVWNNEFFQDMRSRFLAANDEKLNAPCKVCTINRGLYPWNGNLV